ncbi:probable LRR receptor-like serine/threonine-protein kinase At1g63430 [Zingiber officinale]|uniref:probable LRR receptor-like serine/threonine-protein kinase At1g63430 n=1 Tax=Zingiber officinale TaxID=94328 RepID=UPI001C4D8C93|nr:probable LRR receptor-like serine/threonine-protein kinase At1g63430 [Zingiber officinale]
MGALGCYVCKKMKKSPGFQFLLVLIFNWRVLLAQVHSFPHYEVSALVSFKRAAFEDPFSALSDWNPLDGSPCSWTGVTCSANQDSVVFLNLSGSSLKGFLTPELRNLGCLQELHLNNNLLLGTIPVEIGMLKNLTVLDLSMNQLTGPIPPMLGELTAIKKLDLHSNELTGNIPPELGKLENLVELRLDRNRLEGQIPGGSNLNVSATSHGVHDSKSSDLCHLSKLRTGDFSYNFLVGQIPSCLKYLQRSSFQGNCFQDKYWVLQRTLRSCHSNKNQAIAKEKDKQFTDEYNKHPSPQQPEWLLILEVTTGFIILVFIITGIATAVRTCKLKNSEKIHWKKKMSWKGEMSISIDGDILKNVPRFIRAELEIACEDFSNIIGTSSHGMVYKGTMKDATEVAVISLCNLEDQWTNYLELSFHTKVADLARMDHENLPKLLGYCKETEPFSRMLVLGYASNGTLYEHIHYGDGSQLSWIRRMKIILGVARGLQYLHTELQPPFVLSEISSNAVYLTEDFSPKLVDFKSCKVIFSESKKSAGYITNGGSLPGHNSSREQQDMEIQANIFAFGVLLLEIISGRPPNCKERGCLITWATEYLQNPEEKVKLVDPGLKNVKSEDLTVICSVVSLCIEPDPTKRPSMQAITGMLEEKIELSAAALLKESPLVWAELALSS